LRACSLSWSHVTPNLHITGLSPVQPYPQARPRTLNFSLAERASPFLLRHHFSSNLFTSYVSLVERSSFDLTQTAARFAPAPTHSHACLPCSLIDCSPPFVRLSRTLPFVTDNPGWISSLLRCATPLRCSQPASQPALQRQDFESLHPSRCI